MPILCIAKFKENKVAQIDLSDALFTYIGGSPGFKAEIMPDLRRISAQGVAVYNERIDENGIQVVLDNVKSDDEMFDAGVVEHFQSKGYWAKIYSSKQAEVWRILQILPLSEEIENSLLVVIDTVKGDDLDRLLKRLREAEKEMAHISKEKREMVKKRYLEEGKLMEELVKMAEEGH